MLPRDPTECGLVICRDGKVEGDRKTVRGFCSMYGFSDTTVPGKLEMPVVVVIADVRRVESGEDSCSTDWTTDGCSGENGKMSFGVLGSEASPSE